MDSFNIGTYVIAVYDHRWYVGKMIGLNGEEITVSYMTPVRGMWKWGRKDEDTMHKDEVLMVISEPTKAGNLYEIKECEKESANNLLKELLSI